MTVQVREPTQDLIKEFRPHQRQEDLLRIPDSIFEALYGGAAYGGKSFLLTLFPLIRGFHKQRGFKGIILRRKFPDLEREIIRTSLEWYPKTGGKYNSTQHSWHWPDYGSYMDFGHCLHAKDIRQYDGYQANFCGFDELTHFEESMYVYMVGSRVRPSNDFNIAIVRNTTNPGGIGQTFTFNRFVKPCESGYKIIVDKKTGLKRIFIPCLPQDNPYGMAYDPQYLQKLELLSEAEKKAKKYGDWHAFEGSVFPEFRPIRFPDEPENALHIVPYFEIPEWWPRLLSVDWGKRAMCHALWAAIGPDNRAYIYRERHWKGVDVPYWAAEIKEASWGEQIVDFILCGSAWQERGVETIAEQVERHSGLRPRTSTNSPGSRISGLNLIHDFLRWESKKRHQVTEVYDPELAEMIFRRFGTNAKNSYLAQYLDEPEETNLPRLQILESPLNSAESVAPKLVETLPNAVYDEVRKEDIQEFDGDDPIDNLRYLCKSINQYCNGSLEDEKVRRERVNVAVQTLHQTGNFTTFYRQMEHLENNQEGSFGVRRHRPRRH